MKPNNIVYNTDSPNFKSKTNNNCWENDYCHALVIESLQKPFISRNLKGSTLSEDEDHCTPFNSRSNEQLLRSRLIVLLVRFSEKRFLNKHFYHVLLCTWYIPLYLYSFFILLFNHYLNFPGNPKWHKYVSKYFWKLHIIITTRRKWWFHTSHRIFSILRVYISVICLYSDSNSLIMHNVNDIDSEHKSLLVKIMQCYRSGFPAISNDKQNHSFCETHSI